MPEFATSEACVERLRSLFEALAFDDAGEKIAAKTKLAFRLRIRDPNADLHIDCRQRPLSFMTIKEGTKPPPADLEIAATGDVAHGIFSGTVALGTAYRSKQVIVTGNFLKVMGMAPLFQVLQRLYPSIIDGTSGAGAGKA